MLLRVVETLLNSLFQLLGLYAGDHQVRWEGLSKKSELIKNVDFVIIRLGTNDIHQSMVANPDHFRADIKGLINQAK